MFFHPNSVSLLRLVACLSRVFRFFFFFFFIEKRVDILFHPFQSDSCSSHLWRKLCYRIIVKVQVLTVLPRVVFSLALILFLLYFLYLVLKIFILLTPVAPVWVRDLQEQLLSIVLSEANYVVQHQNGGVLVKLYFKL